MLWEAERLHVSEIDAEDCGCADLIEVKTTGLVLGVTQEKEETCAVGQ
jgi:hypothetical protein